MISPSGRYSSYRYGTSIQFMCIRGYRMEGSDSLTCEEDGWNPPPPQCNVVTCDAPNINNTFIVGRNASYRYATSIQVMCNTGYRMEGSDVLTCEEYDWNPPPPKCNIVTCLKPSEIMNGQYTPVKEVYEYGQNVTYTCEEGLWLYGASTISCTDDGTFQPPPPQCMDVFCDRLEIPNAVRIEGKPGPFKYNNFVRFQCVRGFKMEGSDFLTCTENGWNPPPPQCNVITCSEPPTITNGQFMPQKYSYTYGVRVIYYCMEGFKLYGSPTISCSGDGKFEPSPPESREIFCDSPFIRNAVIDESLPSYRYRSSIAIKCNKGHRLEGSDYLTCGKNGWTPALPRCAPLTCDAPKIANADVVGKDTQ